MVEASHSVGAASRPLGVLEAGVVRPCSGGGGPGLLGLAGLQAVEVQQVLGHDGGAAGPRAPLQAEHVQQRALEVAEQLMALAVGGGRQAGWRATLPFLGYQTGMASLPQQDVA